MPRLSKKALSQFIRSGCLRRLRLNLYPAVQDYKNARAEQGMPKPEKDRPGLEDLKRSGREWEQTVYDDVITTFEDDTFYERSENRQGELIYNEINLQDCLTAPKPPEIAIEATYDPPLSFLDNFPALGTYIDQHLVPNDEQFDISNVRPDLIFISCPANSDLAPDWAQRCLSADGQIQTIADEDHRRALRVVDIKMSASPSAAYLCEVAYYAWSLAVWLEENGLNDRYFVSADPGVWPGSLDGSKLGLLRHELWNDEHRLPTTQEAWEAIQADVEFYSVELFVERVHAFFDDEVIQALTPAGEDWREELPWHISSRCIGCDYLGYGWFNNPAHPGLCWNEAAQNGHLSRVAGLSQGAAVVLRQRGVQNVIALAATEPNEAVYDAHHTLKAKRTAIHARANVLGSGSSELIDRAGTSAILPRWSDVNLYVRADFDIASSRTICFAYRGFAYINDQDNSSDGTFFVEDPTLESELRACLNFLTHINDFISRASDPQNPVAFDGASDHLTFQCYVWDELTIKHLQRVFGRHLADILADPLASNLAWLFPPDQLFDDPNFSGAAGPISLVTDAVNAILAADIPHRYTLLQVADLFRHERLPEEFTYNMSDLFRDPLSDQVPSERAHEIWTKREGPPRNYQEIQRRFGSSSQTYLRALENVTRACREALGDRLRTNAPPLSIIQPRIMDPVIGWDLQILLEHTRLNAKAQELETLIYRVLPSHEREARFRCVRLTRLKTGREKLAALRKIGEAPDDELLVFEVSRRSVDAKLKDGEFNWSLLPEDLIPTAQYTVAWHENQAEAYLDISDNARYSSLGYATRVQVERFDRNERELIVRLSSYYGNRHLKLIQEGILDYASINAENGRYGALDPWPVDFFTKKLRESVRRIGDPQIARDNPLSPAHQGAHIRARRRRARPTDETPAAPFIWTPELLVDELRTHDMDAVDRVLEDVGATPTAEQLRAIHLAVSRRLTVLWGPPGSGKSQTSAEAILGLVASANAVGETLRILVTGPNWVSIATVFRKLPKLFEQAGIDYDLSWRGRPDDEPVPGTLLERNTDEYAEFCQFLDAPEIHQIVGSTADQIGNLLSDRDGFGLSDEIFDFILLDEASQMDVAHTLCVLQALAADGSLTLVGDHLQMPPIQMSEPPLGYENVVGSILAFYRDYYGISSVMLDRSFRSNETIISFVRESGYGDELQPTYPDRTLLFNEPIPAMPPENWSEDLPWSEHYASILRTDRPLIAIRHREGISAQSSELEAQWVSAIVSLLANHASGYSDGPEDIKAVERDGWNKIFENEIGIVTPHRAQLSRIVTLLQATLPMVEPNLIRGAVDTVERFQGQERTSIIASFAVGDPDAIAMEEEFLFNLERFNVIASRARAKLIVFIDEALWRHLPTETKLLAGAKLLKRYGGSALPNSQEITLNTSDGENEVPGEIRWKDA